MALPEPDFEDETTVVSARQVVPLDQARVQDRRRRLFAVLPLLVAATFCGALGAMVVNYFERPATEPTISQPAIVTAKDELRPSIPAPSPDTSATTKSPKTEMTSESSQPADALPTSATSSDSVENRAGAKPEQDSTSVKKPASSADPRQLVRQRRVHPATDQPAASPSGEPKARGAARIQDIFSGPNH
jgi:cytoskeletal protein RodZ